MTGPQHYREAENLLIQVDDGAADWEPIVAAAQVHATLALAAATALNPSQAGFILDWNAWRKAASEDKPAEVTA